MSKDKVLSIKDNKINLCDSCLNVYPCVELNCNIIFGDGVGNDNVAACNKYIPKGFKHE